jgi:hypothetical protein
VSQEQLLPNKVPSYIKRLELDYRQNTSSLHYQTLKNSHLFIQANTSYTEWNGGMHGHTIIFFLEAAILKHINLSEQKKICTKLSEDIDQLNTIEDEFIHKVSIEIYEEENPECKSSKNIFNQSITNIDIPTVWKPKNIRLFISHRDNVKTQAKQLAEYLEAYGISSFVAHDTIEPMEKWQHVIKKSLHTMNFLLAFITDDFFQSHWTNQEIGVALGRNIPIISIKLAKTDPCGFISDTQALPGNINDLEQISDNIYSILIQKLGQESQLKDSVIQAFIKTPTWQQSDIRFNRLKKLSNITPNDIEQICRGYKENKQLHESYFLTKSSDFQNFLEEHLGKGVKINGKEIISPQVESTEVVEVPF